MSENCAACCQPITEDAPGFFSDLVDATIHRGRCPGRQPEMRPIGGHDLAAIWDNGGGGFAGGVIEGPAAFLPEEV